MPGCYPDRMRGSSAISRNVRRAAAVAGLVLLTSCGGSDADKDAPTTTSTVAPLTKNAALNNSVNTPSGSVRPGGKPANGTTVRPVRSP